MNKYGFVHIPKTGGTSVCKFLLDNYPDNFICSRFDNKPYHSLTTKDIDNPIVIIRCPIERFLSSFYYWKYGPKNGPWVNKYNNHNNQISIEKFIELFESDPSIVNTNITWRLHFQPQHDWIFNEDFAKTVIIKYHNDLQKSILKLIKYLNLNDPSSKLEAINISKKEPITITNIVKNYILNKYQKDYELIELINSTQNIFRQII